MDKSRIYGFMVVKKKTPIATFSESIHATMVAEAFQETYDDTSYGVKAIYHPIETTFFCDFRKDHPELVWDI